MAGTLTLESFAPAVGETFVLEHPQAGRIALVLAEARAIGDEPFRDRAPFALLFRGPADPLLPQGTYAIAGEKLGRLDIFIVPVERDAGGSGYEAIFT